MHSTTRMRDSSGLESIAFDPEISKPEPLQFDTSAQSIQRDHDADAPEVAAVADGSDAPMTIVSSAPELYHQAPTVLEQTEEKVVVEDERQSAASAFRSKRRLLVMIVILALIVALVLGLGVGLTREKNGAVSGSSAIPTSVPQLVLESSAFAAAELKSHDKLLFFQDPQANLHRVLFSAAQNRWISVALLPSSAVGIPRNNTPLALSIGEAYTFLYFVDSQNRLIEVTMAGNDTNFFGTPILDVKSNQTIAAYPGSQALSAVVTGISPSYDEDPWSVTLADREKFLLYQNSSGNVSLILQELSVDSNGLGSTIWNDPNTILYESLGTASLGTPFASLFSNITEMQADGFSNGPSSFTAAFYDQHAPEDQNLVYVYRNYSDDSFITTSSPISKDKLGVPTSNFDASSLLSSDLATFDVSSRIQEVWLNGSKLACGYTDSACPSSTFNFPHFGVLASSNTTYPQCIYHQVNGAAIEELTYDSTNDVWSSVLIDIAALSSNST